MRRTNGAKGAARVWTGAAVQAIRKAAGSVGTSGKFGQAGTGRFRGARAAAAGLMLAAAVSMLVAIATALPAAAQSWLPWGRDAGPPTPREPVYKTPPPPPAQPPPQAFGQGVPGNRPQICLQLEQRLALEANRGSQARDQLPRIENEIRQTDRAYQVSQAQLERSDCYDWFLFAKSLKRTKACVDLAGQGEAAKRKLAELEGQRQQIMQSGGHSLRDDIVRELARNNCGATYQQEARNSSPFSGLWQDEDSGAGAGNRFGTLPFATYRTICVRLCDGYYFPVSFSTLPNHFDTDADVCQQRCAAPAELYYHQNPGGAVEQAVSHKTKLPYTQLKTAFRYRKEFVAGCSCKQTEYTPLPGVAAPATTDRPGERRTLAPTGGPLPPVATGRQ